MVGSLLIAGLLLTSPITSDEVGDGLPGVLNGPTRGEVAALVREIGRDEPTDAVVDVVLSYFRPRNIALSRDLEKTVRILKDPAFVAELDGIASEFTNAPATTVMMVDRAMDQQVGRSTLLDRERSGLRLKQLTEAPYSFDGKIVDVEGKPMRGVIVATLGGLTTTDDLGRFTLLFHTPPADNATVFFETPGHALGETNFDLDAIDTARGRTYTLRKQAVCDGRVIDAETRAPIPDAEITLWIHIRAFDPDHTSIDPLGQRANRYLTLVTRSDDQGRYAFRGLPPRGEMVEYASTIRATHPNYLTNQDHFGNDQSPRPGITIPMTPGAIVAGHVADPAGNRVPFATVRAVRNKTRSVLATTTADDRGEFRFNNLAEQEIRVAAEAEGYAMTHVPATADRQGPVQLRVQLQHGEFITGTLIGPDGKPAAKATVGTPYLLTDAGEIDNSAPIPTCSAATAEDGTFRLGPLLSGRYRIYGTIQKPEYYRIFVDVPTGPNHWVIGKPPG